MKYLFFAFMILGFAACGTSKATETGAEAVAPASATDAPAAAAETAPEDVLPNDGTRVVGDVTKCPVSGDVFQIMEDSIKVEHEGGTYYFCCKGCVKDFLADPAKFTGGSASDPAAEPAEMPASAE